MSRLIIFCSQTLGSKQTRAPLKEETDHCLCCAVQRCLGEPSKTTERIFLEFALLLLSLLIKPSPKLGNLTL